MLRSIYTKETLTADGKEIVGYTTLTQLLRDEKLEKIYPVVRRKLLEGAYFSIRNINIGKIRLIHHKNERKTSKR